MFSFFKKKKSPEIINPKGVDRLVNTIKDAQEQNIASFYNIMLSSSIKIKKQKENLILVLNTLKVLKDAGVNLTTRETEKIKIIEGFSNLMVKSQDDTTTYDPYINCFNCNHCYCLLDANYEITAELRKQYGAKIFRDMQNFADDLEIFIKENVEYLNML